MLLVGGGAHSVAYRQVVADLAQRAVAVVDAPEPVALGACVQAAARATNASIAAVQDAWGLGTGTTTEPGASVDAAADTRARYAAARDLGLD